MALCLDKDEDLTVLAAEAKGLLTEEQVRDVAAYVHAPAAAGRSAVAADRPTPERIFALIQYYERLLTPLPSADEDDEDDEPSSESET